MSIQSSRPALPGIFRQHPGAVLFLSAFIVCWAVFFVGPVFLNAERTMAFPKYLPAQEAIGADHEQMRDFMASWALEGGSPYIGKNLYPPLTILFFAPMLAFPAEVSYPLVAILGLLAFVAASLVLPFLLVRDRPGASVVVPLVFLAGLAGYGLQFELERGQFNVLAYFFALLAVWLFHNRPRAGLAALVLLSLAIQLKVYPAIFALVLVRDWRDWKGNMKRALGLGLANAGLLFVLGPRTFLEFVDAIGKQVVKPFAWAGNHSIRSFVTMLGKRDGNLPTGFLEGSLMLLVVLCTGLVVRELYRRRATGFSPKLLFVCTLAALLLPSVSHDYKLALLPAPFAMALAGIPLVEGNKPQWPVIMLASVCVLAYVTTLFSYVSMPLPLANNCPALMVVLLSFTGLVLLGRGRQAEAVDPGIRASPPRP